MDLGYNNPKASKFVTNVGIITSNGPNGHNIMAAEWTYYVSYSPALMSVHVGRGVPPLGKATMENIRATREFGVSIAASGQNVFASIAGGSSGRDVDKIALLREMGAEFYPAKNIGVLLLKGAAMHAECRVKDIMEIGDHFMVIGEVLDAESDETKEPLAYNFGRYRSIGPFLEKPQQELRDRIDALKLKYTKKK
ncbi:FMN reductase (NADH) RutF [uncultured archaeon]|nr:FMN reductase (NADH) RutF [uncultured archaeon]